MLLGADATRPSGISWQEAPQEGCPCRGGEVPGLAGRAAGGYLPGAVAARGRGQPCHVRSGGGIVPSVARRAESGGAKRQEDGVRPRGPKSAHRATSRSSAAAGGSAQAGGRQESARRGVRCGFRECVLRRQARVLASGADDSRAASGRRGIRACAAGSLGAPERQSREGQVACDAEPGSNAAASRGAPRQGESAEAFGSAEARQGQTCWA
mmetsp:Transcript_335/g.1324  ORF Transcript_335/g.1324 Transcript_335/m.1324 type:complete len:211 (-) Transcript_335:1123-1755(-)